MTLSDIYDVLNSVLEGKVAYRAFRKEDVPKPPYIVFLSTGTDNYAADNSVHFERTNIRIELYEVDRDLTTEASLEAKLTAAGLFWERDDTYIDNEKLYELIYEVQIHE